MAVESVGTRAAAAALLGRPDIALSDLTTMIEDQRHAHLLMYFFMPTFREVRALPGFKPLMRSARLPEYWRQTRFPSICRPVGEDDFECD